MLKLYQVCFILCVIFNLWGWTHIMYRHCRRSWGTSGLGQTGLRKKPVSSWRLWRRSPTAGTPLTSTLPSLRTSSRGMRITFVCIQHLFYSTLQLVNIQNFNTTCKCMDGCVKLDICNCIKTCSYWSYIPNHDFLTYKEKYKEQVGRGKPYDVYLAQVFHGDEPALSRAIMRGSVRKYMTNGMPMCMDVTENVVHRKGWKEGTNGKGTRRQVEDMQCVIYLIWIVSTLWMMCMYTNFIATCTSTFIVCDIMQYMRNLTAWSDECHLANQSMKW